MKTSEILIEARDMISDPSKWIKQAFAYDLDGNVLNCGADGSAVCWCSMGAVQKATNGEHFPEWDAEFYLIKAVNQIEGDKTSVHDFNDENEHADVMQMFSVAIRIAKEDEAQSNTADSMLGKSKPWRVEQPTVIVKENQ
jgi:hypothetical protein